MKPVHIAALAVAALSASSWAGAASAQSVEIKNAVARVVVIPEDRADIGVEIVRGQASLPGLSVKRDGSSVEIDGGLASSRGFVINSNAVSQCKAGDADARQPGQGARVRVRDHGEIRLEDAPLIVLRTPRTVEVASGNAVFGSIGPGAQSLSLATGGCGRWTVGNVAGDAEIAIGGSGDIRMGAVKSLEVAIGGSGNVRVARAVGEIDVAIGGSGDVRIEQGRADQMDVSVAGSGGVYFGGVADQLSVAIVGSGDVRVKEVRGEISRSIMGSGKVHVGD